MQLLTECAQGMCTYKYDGSSGQCTSTLGCCKLVSYSSDSTIPSSAMTNSEKVVKVGTFRQPKAGRADLIKMLVCIAHNHPPAL